MAIDDTSSGATAENSQKTAEAQELSVLLKQAMQLIGEVDEQIQKAFYINETGQTLNAATRGTPLAKACFRSLRQKLEEQTEPEALQAIRSSLNIASEEINYHNGMYVIERSNPELRTRIEATGNALGLAQMAYVPEKVAPLLKEVVNKAEEHLAAPDALQDE